MQSDTVIGIVGAVVLVAVMIGVFAYEYNNAPEVDEGPDPDSTEAKMAAFNATYPTLVATEDLDGDGDLNYEDDDIDGDGTPNAADNMTAHSHDFDGTVPQQAPGGSQTATEEFFVGTGALGGMVTVTWTVTNPGGLGAVDNLVVSISGVPCDSGTGSATCDLTGIEPGTYTISVSHANAAAQAKSFTGSYTVEY